MARVGRPHSDTEQGKLVIGSVCLRGYAFLLAAIAQTISEDC